MKVDGVSPPRRSGVWLWCTWEFGSDRGVTYDDWRIPWFPFLGAALYRRHWQQQHAPGMPWSTEVTLAADPTVIPAWEATLECGHQTGVHEPTIGRKHVCPECRVFSRVTGIRPGEGLRAAGP